MIARRDGKCATCDGAIFAGLDEIAPDAQGRWGHARAEDCDAADVDGLRQPTDVGKPICRVCRCVMPCWCDDGGQPEDAADQALRRAVDNAGRDPFEGFL